VAGGEAFVAPVSFAQERLWFLDRLEPGRPTYNIPMALRLPGPLEPDVVAGALADLATRHEVLRTTFRDVAGEPVQVVAAEPTVDLGVVDLTGVRDAERLPAAHRLAEEDACRPFDLAAGPLVRSTLVRLAADDHVLLLTMHHIVADLWSAAVLARDFGTLLEGRRRGIPADQAGLPELPIQYADFAEWQRRRLSGPARDGLVGYWAAQLAGAPAEVTFPLDHPRPPQQSFRGTTVPFAVPASTAAALARLSRDEGATPFMTLVAAFDVVLGRYAGLDDVCVGTPIAGRTRSEVEDLIGFFSNTLVLRTSLAGDPTFREVVGRARSVTLGAYDHQELPFEQLVAVLGIDRNPSLPPLFQVLFGLNTRQGGQPSGAAATGWPEIGTGTAKFDATVLMRELADGTIEGAFEYATDLYEPATVDRVIDHFLACLDAVAADPDVTVGALAATVFAGPPGDDERCRGPVADVPWASPVEAVEDRARRTPGALAVVAGAARLTFGQLDELADRVAAVVAGAGAGPGDRVGICMGAVAEMPAAVLGTLKAGAAYVPLDPSYPPDRLAWMAEDAALAAVLLDPAAAGVVPAGTAPRIVLAPGCKALSDPGPPGQQRAPSRAPRAGAADPAYVIYTSGSTGRPKGVVMTHGALANLVAWQVAGSPHAPRTLQLAPLSFDVSFQELFTTWAAGGAVVLCDEQARRDPAVLVALAREHRVERIFLPPAMLQLLADVAEPGAWPPTVRELVTAGEALRITPSVRRALAALPGAVLRNQYGPSETHVVTEHRAAAADPDLADLPPIGRPIQNVTTHVLDEAMVPVPLGARGELYVGGAAVAGGYLGRPALTAERFVPDPFSAPGGRLYRTGDVVRSLPDGTLQFLGRVDDQLKVRGYRVEPGEVEAELERAGGVRAAAVVGHAEPAGGPVRLVAYVEAAGEGVAAPARLRDRLRGRLPPWMVPERILVVDRLPLTPSGKVDRRALAGRDLATESAGAATVPPRSSLEAAVCAIWAEVLGVDAVGVTDSFFDLGGHSLAVARVAARVDERLGVDLPMRAYFDATTVEDLTREIVLHRAAALGASAVAAILGDDETAASHDEVVTGVH
jgi:amino acid adenylation domain-containing protein